MELNLAIDKKASLYPYSNKEAHRLGVWHVQLWSESFAANVSCKKAIEQLAEETTALAPDCLTSMIVEYGHERVQWVLANSITMHEQRDEISAENVAWAKNEFQPLDKNMGMDYRLKYAAKVAPEALNKLATTMQAEYAALKLWDISHCTPKEGLDYTGRVMVVSASCLKHEYKAPDYQLILCKHGFGCKPEASGRKVFGKFLFDDEQCQFERSDFVGALKQELWPDWLRQKIEQGEQTQSMEIGGMEMQ